MSPAQKPSPAVADERAEAEAHIQYPEEGSPVGGGWDNFPYLNSNASAIRITGGIAPARPEEEPCFAMRWKARFESGLGL